MFSNGTTGDGGSFERFDQGIEGLGDEIADLACRIDAAKHRLLTLIREFDEKKGWGRDGAVSCAQWLSWRLGLDAGAAREKVRVAKALGRLPRVDEAYRQGKLSYSKIRAITRVAIEENEDILLHYALNSTGAMMEKICRSYRKVVEPLDDGSLPEGPSERYVRAVDVGFGMVRIEAQLPCDEAALVMRALDGVRFTGNREVWKEREKGAAANPEEAHAAAKEDAGSLPSGFDRADALVALAQSVLQAGTVRTSSAAPRFEVVMNVDAATLRGESEVLATLDDRWGIPTEMARRVACDASLVEMEVDEKGDVLGVGRKRRTIPPSIRRALRKRDGGCRFPGCTHDRFVDGHHVVHWADGGETKLKNLVLLCRHHHRLVHEEGFTVAMAEDGPIFRNPEGEVIERVRGRASLGEGDAPMQGFLSWLDKNDVSKGIEGYPLPDYLGWDLGLTVEALLQRSREKSKKKWRN